MGIFRSARQRRHEKRATYKAAKVQAKTEAREYAKLDAKKEQYLQKMAKKVRKEDKRQLKAQQKHDQKMATATIQQIKAGRFNAGTVLRYTGALRVLLPVVIPLAYRGLTQLSQRGQNGGAAPSAFVGVGAAQRARIADLRNRIERADVSSGFAKDATERLDQLETSLDNADTMSDSQASSLTSSVSTELDLLDRQLSEKA
ncbi:MAG TPA: hypothetical protein H9870_13450 [Candidatus Corynebacterium avicola]|uniref:Uncharacterized protein n=1 Tax=Candidatus Corynebacterium avicola TaxID=2838527 RepID=A0A9D1ULX9_9CORY|nr:hypothetical protein [Candidatus Corynebacterium avicola]